MRPLYLLLKILIWYALKLFFKRTKKVNSPKQFNAQTIFVSNHASAFMDPWIIAQLQRPVLFFLTRGDIFKKWLAPITWAAHMIPIYRTKENGADSAEKNEAIFREVYGLLKRKKSILIFGEGYTDDIFIRSLKPLKKGPARIGFGAMVATNWEADIKIQPAGINYADPNEFRSEVLVANAEPIHLKDYKDRYLENPSKTIVEVTKTITQRLEEQLTILRNVKLTDLHNHIQSITKKGIAHNESDLSIPIEKRWRYSQQLAKIINVSYQSDDQSLSTLKTTLSEYFTELKSKNIRDKWVVNRNNQKSTNIILRWLILLILSPIFLLGCFHHFVPYQFVKRFTENTFKRRVFWSGIKMLMGYLVFSIYNIALCLIINHYLHIVPTGILWAYLIFTTPPIGIVAYWFATYFSDTIKLSKFSAKDYQHFAEKRAICENQIKHIIKIES